jgi:hypothetical protein
MAPPPIPVITEDIVFQHISSPLGMPGSPFDKALAMRDQIVVGFIQKINRLPYRSLNGGILSDLWGNEVKANNAAIFPGMGNFGPGGGPLA